VTRDRSNGDRGNHNYRWDEFDSTEYFRYNYANLRDDDRTIVEVVRDFFARELVVPTSSTQVRGVDVGTGANLYPALTLLPFCTELVLYEHSIRNVRWLREQLESEVPTWNEAWSQFWDLLAERPQYAELTRPTELLTDPSRVHVVQGNVFARPTLEPFDVGTMFFVAESITGERVEFLTAMHHFFSMLKPNAPFVTAFMEHSRGYRVGTQRFPATDVGGQDVWNCLRDYADELSLHRLDAKDEPLREHYTGMLLAHGRRSG
jgi:hypothetical protein